MNPMKVSRNKLLRLTDLPNIGPAGARDLELLGFSAPAELIGADPMTLYRSLCVATGARQDPCVLDVFMSVTDFLAGGSPQPWWNFTERRKREYGTLEAASAEATAAGNTSFQEKSLRVSNKSKGDVVPKNPRTPDGRYMVVRGRLWRVANPQLPSDRRQGLVEDLMDARRAVKAALASGDKEQLSAARRSVDAAKVALGERGPVWWQDGAADYNRYLVKNTPYKTWYDALCAPHD